MSSTHPYPVPIAPCTVDDVRAAHARIGGLIRRTPVVVADVPTPHGPVPVHFKLEFLQLGGSFKIRGSLTAILAARERGELAPGSAETPAKGPGVVIASGGNAAIGAAHAAAMLGVACVVVVPTTAPVVKVQRLTAAGARVHQVGAQYSESAAAAIDLAASTGSVLLHAYDLPDIVAGAGTIGFEITDQVPGPVDHLVAVGGGGLIGGISAAAGSDDRVIGVEPEGAATLNAAVHAGRPVPVGLSSIASDSLGATQIGEICWATCRPGGTHPVTSLVVSDAAIVAARQWLWDDMRIAVELGTAAALAPVLAGTVRAVAGRSVSVLLCGANTAIADLDGFSRSGRPAR